MLMVAFLQWWYGPGWRDAAQRLRDRLRDTYLGFSVPLLLPTLFAPWRRIVSVGGGSLQDRLRAVIDNLVSRTVGFAVRLLTLIAACLLLAGYAVVGGIALVLWPALPVLGPALIVVGVL